MLQLQPACGPRRAFVEAYGDLCLQVVIPCKNITRSCARRGLQGAPKSHLLPLSPWIPCLHPGIGSQKTIQSP